MTEGARQVLVDEKWLEELLTENAELRERADSRYSPIEFAEALATNGGAIATLAGAIEQRLAIVPTVNEIVRGVLRAISDNVLTNPARGE